MIQSSTITQSDNAKTIGLPDFRLAFQPIFDARQLSVFGYEALVRGPQGESATETLDAIHPDLSTTFDKTICYRAISAAQQQGLKSTLSVNCSADEISDPENFLTPVLSAAVSLGFPLGQLMFELVEIDHSSDHQNLNAVFAEYRESGVKTAIDAFGSGYADFNLLADWQPDFVKLDINLLRNIHMDLGRQVIVRSLVETLNALKIRTIAVGVENRLEWAFLRAAGIELFQGYFFAKPVMETLNEIDDKVWQKLSTPLAHS